MSSSSKRFCSVPQCSSYISEEVSLHYFPLKDKKLCEKWKTVLKIGKVISKYMNVCSKHFVKDDFMPITTLTKRKRLKKGVVPSQNLPVRFHDKKKPAERSKRLSIVPSKLETLHSQTGKASCAATPTTMMEIVAPEIVPKHIQPQYSFDVEPQTESTYLEKSYVDKSTQTEDCILPNILLNSDEKLQSFTNVDFHTLQTLEECCENILALNNESGTDLRMKLMLLLMKLKLNIPLMCLSVIFNISPATCSRYFYFTLSLLCTAISPALYWPSKGEILSNMPKCFKGFVNTRIVLDCTEIAVDKCKCLKCRILSYSHYKGRHTLKFLIGITPSGQISYVSKAHGGRASDKGIFNKEKLIEKLDPLDAVMVDKGFLIDKECHDNLITLIRPPFLRKSKQFSKADAEKTAQIARARIHVERAIQKLKTYRIVSDQIAWYFVPHIDEIMTVVAALVNLSPPILADDKFIHALV